jgi:hypothetical protein
MSKQITDHAGRQTQLESRQKLALHLAPVENWVVLAPGFGHVCPEGENWVLDSPSKKCQTSSASMKLYYALEQVPELSGLSKDQRRFAVSLYGLSRMGTPGSRMMEGALVATLIPAMLAGSFVGYVLWHNSFIGLLLGGEIALFSVLCVLYFVNLCFVAPKFRQFLQTDGCQFMLRNARTPGAASAASAPPPPEAVAEFLRPYRTDDGTPMSLQGKTEAVKKVGNLVAQSTEIMELVGELTNESLRSSDSIRQKSLEASQAFRSLRLGKWLRLSREIVALKTEGSRLLVRLQELLTRGEATLALAGAALTELKKN